MHFGSLAERAMYIFTSRRRLTAAAITVNYDYLAVFPDVPAIAVEEIIVNSLFYPAIFLDIAGFFAIFVQYEPYWSLLYRVKFTAFI